LVPWGSSTSTSSSDLPVVGDTHGEGSRCRDRSSLVDPRHARVAGCRLRHGPRVRRASCLAQRSGASRVPLGGRAHGPVARSEALSKMVGADDVSRIEVQAVGCQPARADAGVEMHLAAAQALSLGVNPPEQFAGEASLAGGGHGGQVVDVYMPSPAQAGTEPEAGDGHCVGAIIWQHTHQPVASRPLNTVDLLDEVLQAR
jgi:hypothetical protein